MTTASSVARNTLGLATARIIERISGFVLIVVVARLMDPEDLGIYATAVSFFAIVGIAGELGTTNFLIRELAREPARTASYLLHLGALATVFASLIAVVGWIVMPLAGYSGPLLAGMLLVSLAFPAAVLRTIQEAVFVAHERVAVQTAVTFVAAVVGVAASLVAIAAGGGAVALVAVFVVVQWAVAVAYFVVIDRWIASLRCRLNFRVAFRLLMDVRSFAAISICAALFSQPEILILSGHLSAAQAGFYVAALKLVNIWQIIPQTVMTNVLPVLSRQFGHNEAQFERIQQAAVKYLLAVSLPLGVGIAVTAPSIVSLFYGDDFATAASCLRILAWIIPVLSLNAVLWRILIARRRQNWVLQSLAVSTAVRIGAGIALIYFFGVTGACFAAAAGLTLHTVLLASFVKRDGVRLSVVAVGRKFLTAAVAMGAVVAVALRRFELLQILPLVVAVYWIIVWRLRAFTSDEILAIRRAFRVATH